MRLLRLPLTWLVLAEIAVVSALGAATWHVIGPRVATTPGAVTAAGLGVLTGVVPTPLATPAGPVPIAISTPTPRRAGPTPGLGASSAFLGAQLKAVNRDQSAWERGEWSIIEAVLGFAREYIERVVLPSIHAAEAAGR